MTLDREIAVDEDSEYREHVLELLKRAMENVMPTP
jgi:hypothetical protein